VTSQLSTKDFVLELSFASNPAEMLAETLVPLWEVKEVYWISIDFDFFSRTCASAYINHFARFPFSHHLLQLSQFFVHHVRVFRCCATILIRHRYQFRRSALRLLASSPSSIISKPRALSSLASSLPRARLITQSLTFQRRWATNDAAKEEEEVPISEIQPTPQEEVENAIHEDSMAAAGDAAPDAAAAQATFEDKAASIPPRTNRGIYAENDPKPSIYLGNLFFDLTENDIKRTFSQFGEVQSVRILRDMRGLSKG
jgi:hypothetical protein